MIMPRGLSGRLPVRSSIDTNEIFGILTGITSSTGTEPTEACAEWPMVGQFKLCKQQHPFGQQGRESQVLNVKYAGQIVNRGEFTDNVLFGQPNMGDNVAAGPIDWGRAPDRGEKKLAMYRATLENHTAACRDGSSTAAGPADRDRQARRIRRACGR
jgi:hypothetical protein